MELRAGDDGTPPQVSNYDLVSMPPNYLVKRVASYLCTCRERLL